MRLIKVIIKNLNKFHPRYFYLLLKSEQTVHPPIKKQNIFIVTSCVNTNENIAYVNHNIDHTPEQRIEETITGLQSITKYYPDAYIIFLESSKLVDGQKERLEKFINAFFDLSAKTAIKIARKHCNKGVPQFTALINFLEENSVNYEADTLHFLGARYILTGSIANEFDVKGSYFLYYKVNNNVSTRYFFMKNLQLIDLINPFRRTLYFSMFGNSVEDVIHGFVPMLKTIERINVCGIVNGKELISE